MVGLAGFFVVFGLFVVVFGVGFLVVVVVGVVELVVGAAVVDVVVDWVVLVVVISAVVLSLVVELIEEELLVDGRSPSETASEAVAFSMMGSSVRARATISGEVVTVISVLDPGESVGIKLCAPRERVVPSEG